VEKKKEKERIYKKKFENGKYYKITPTIVKEFNFSASHKTKGKLDEINKNKLKNQRKSMNTDDYFDVDAQTFLIGINYKINNDIQIDEAELVNAINYLHNILNC